MVGLLSVILVIVGWNSIVNSVRIRKLETIKEDIEYQLQELQDEVAELKCK